MLIIQEIEKQTKQLYMQQKIRGFCHVYNGQVSTDLILINIQ